MIMEIIYYLNNLVFNFDTSKHFNFTYLVKNRKLYDKNKL